MNIELRPLRDFEEDDFIRENQIAFDKAAVVEFGPQKESVIPREDIVSSIHAKNAEAFRIIADGNAVGGVVVAIHPEIQSADRTEQAGKSIFPECRYFQYGRICRLA